ncbi:MAG: hypothetical protein ACFN0X_04135 [Mitsuokella sp.]
MDRTKIGMGLLFVGGLCAVLPFQLPLLLEPYGMPLAMEAAGHGEVADFAPVLIGAGLFLAAKSLQGAVEKVGISEGLIRLVGGMFFFSGLCDALQVLLSVSDATLPLQAAVDNAERIFLPLAFLACIGLFCRHRVRFGRLQMEPSLAVMLLRFALVLSPIFFPIVLLCNLEWIPGPLLLFSSVSVYAGLVIGLLILQERAVENLALGTGELSQSEWDQTLAYHRRQLRGSIQFVAALYAFSCLVLGALLALMDALHGVG